MQAEHNEERPEGADNEAGDGRLEVDEGHDEGSDEVGEDRSDRADHDEADDAADEEGEDVGEEGGHEGRQPVVERLVHLGGKPDDEDGRDDRGGVALHDQRNAEDVAVDVGLEDGASADRVNRVVRHEGDERRVDEDATECHAHDRLQAEALCGGVADDQREEVEDGVADGREDHIGRAVRGEPASNRAEGQHRLDEAACHKDAEDRLEDLGDDAQEPRERVLLLPVLAVALGIPFIHIECRLLGEAADLDEVVVDGLDRSADDDLILATSLDHVDDALRCLETVGVSLGLVLQMEAQARDAVADILHVVLAAHLLYDRFTEFLILHRGILSEVSPSLMTSTVRFPSRHQEVRVSPV